MSTTVNNADTPNRWFYMSAYATAVKHGYMGTEEDWLRDVYGGAGRAEAAADAAAASAEAASGSASDSEAYGAGTRGGEAVTEDDPAHHNNAMYYAQEAAGSAEAAGDSAEAAAASEAAAKDYADNIADPVSGIVTDWLNDHHIAVDPENYLIDASLNTEGEAADAKATGDAIKVPKADIKGWGIDDLLWKFQITGGEDEAGLDITPDAEARSIAVSGTISGILNLEICSEYISTSSVFQPGKTYFVRSESPSGLIRLKVEIKYSGHSSQSVLFRTNNTGYFRLPDDTTRVRIYLAAYSSAEGEDVDEVIYPSITIAEPEVNADGRTDALLGMYGVKNLLFEDTYVLPTGSYSPTYISTKQTNGINMECYNNTSWKIDGTSTAAVDTILYQSYFSATKGLPSWAVRGKKYHAKINSPSGNVRLRVHEFDADNNRTYVLDTATEADFRFSESAVKARIDLHIDAGKTIPGEVVMPSITDAMTLYELEDKIDRKRDAGTLKVLFIGNSYTQDCVSYLPFLFKKHSGAELVCGIAYHGGASISDYKSYFDNASTAVTYFRCSSNDTAWGNGASSKTIQEILAAEDWDVITVQQASMDQGDWSTFSDLNPLINNIVDYMRTTHEKAVKVGWLMPQLRLVSPDTRPIPTYADQQACVQNVLTTTPVDFVIPCGTAIETARTTSLDELGATANKGLVADSGGHLEDGVPCLLTAYVALLKILSLMGVETKGILGETTRPDSTWVDEHNIPASSSAVTEVTEGDCLLAQKCAVAAIKNPYQISTIFEEGT